MKYLNWNDGRLSPLDIEEEGGVWFSNELVMNSFFRNLAALFSSTVGSCCGVRLSGMHDGSPRIWTCDFGIAEGYRGEVG